MKLKTTRRTRNVALEILPRDSGSPSYSGSELALKKILLPVDFSEQSRKALAYAVSFARQFQADIILLHIVEMVVPPPTMVVPESSVLYATTREVETKRLSDWKKKIAPRIPVKTMVRDGLAHREIVDVAREKNVDLIILGTQGRSGLAHLLIGSTAERVVQHAPCPVMVVRERERDFVAVGAIKKAPSLATRAKRRA